MEFPIQLTRGKTTTHGAPKVKNCVWTMPIWCFLTGVLETIQILFLQWQGARSPKSNYVPCRYSSFGFAIWGNHHWKICNMNCIICGDPSYPPIFYLYIYIYIHKPVESTRWTGSSRGNSMKSLLDQDPKNIKEYSQNTNNLLGFNLWFPVDLPLFFSNLLIRTSSSQTKIK